RKWRLFFAVDGGKSHNRCACFLVWRKAPFDAGTARRDVCDAISPRTPCTVVLELELNLLALLELGQSRLRTAEMCANTSLPVAPKGQKPTIPKFSLIGWERT